MRAKTTAASLGDSEENEKMPHAIDVGWNAVLIIRKNFERMQPAA